MGSNNNKQTTEIHDQSLNAQDQAVILGQGARIDATTTNTTKLDLTDNSNQGNTSTVNYNSLDGGAISNAFDFGATANAQAQSTVKTSLDLLREANAASAALASQSVGSNVQFLNTALAAGQSAQEKQAAQNMQFLESTRQGNQAAAADLATKALDLAEKRTGSESDQLVGIGGKLIWPVVAVVVLILFLIFKKSTK